MNNLTKLGIWALVVAIVFAFMWWRGYVRQIREYCAATMEELKKCTWPTWDELKGSTVVISISIALLGGFIVLADIVFMHIMFWISKI